MSAVLESMYDHGECSSSPWPSILCIYHGSITWRSMIQQIFWNSRMCLPADPSAFTYHFVDKLVNGDETLMDNIWVKVNLKCLFAWTLTNNSIENWCQLWLKGRLNSYLFAEALLSLACQVNEFLIHLLQRPFLEFLLLPVHIKVLGMTVYIVHVYVLTSLPGLTKASYVYPVQMHRGTCSCQE